MENIQYIGERIWPGLLGHALIVLCLVSAALSSWSYYQETKNPNSSSPWKKTGRISFLIHIASIIGIGFLLFYMMVNKFYEYQYVQQHVSDDLPFKYTFSAFWEGMEGSFLLWMFWHGILGLILMRTSGKWESSTLTFLTLIQVGMATMLLGIYIPWPGEFIKIGLNPFLLLRETMDIPLFAQADYVSKIKGNGLNPLLQNYWMTIHPPTLFLGFASTSIPFCFALAALWTKSYQDWLRPVLKWSLFSGGILGTGILMGGAWAYEALSFGGYWAWDPVENTSLVPWLILVAGIHTNLIANATNQAIKATFLFYLGSCIMILYSSFLTKSGILGDTSVHSFTSMGLEWQMLFFLLFFAGLATFFYLRNQKNIPVPAKEENLSSREFWIFMGSLTLLFSSVLITFTTSIPVINKLIDYAAYLSGSNLSAYRRTAPVDVVSHYNKYQLWIGVFMSLFSGVAQWLRFRESNFKNYYKPLLTNLGISIIISGILTYFIGKNLETLAWQNFALLFFGIFTLISNLQYGITKLKINPKLTGSVISHFGFGVLIIGVLYSGLNKTFISSNTFAQQGLIEGFTEEQYNRNVLLIKNAPMFIKDYKVQYVSDTSVGLNRTFKINFQKLDKGGNPTENFDLYPNVLYDKDFTKIAASNPSTQHYLHKDIFTHIASLPRVEMDLEYAKTQEDSLNYITLNLASGQTLTEKTFEAKLIGLTTKPSRTDYEMEPGDFALEAIVKVNKPGNDSFWIAKPMTILREGTLTILPFKINDLSMKFRLSGDIFDSYFDMEKDLSYTKVNLKQGESTTIGGYELKLNGYSKESLLASYKPAEGDLCVQANLEIVGKKAMLNPLFLVREKQALNLKDAELAFGLHARFMKLNPEDGTGEFMIAYKDPKSFTVPVEYAENALRSDYVVLEAIEFPWIKLVWIGSITMLIGFFISMIVRIRQKNQLHIQNA
jgi:cytochrome c-type biogenesis protein CcmF